MQQFDQRTHEEVQRLVSILGVDGGRSILHIMEALDIVLPLIERFGEYVHSISAEVTNSLNFAKEDAPNSFAIAEFFVTKSPSEKAYDGSGFMLNLQVGDKKLTIWYGDTDIAKDTIGYEGEVQVTVEEGIDRSVANFYLMRLERILKQLYNQLYMVQLGQATLIVKPTILN